MKIPDIFAALKPVINIFEKLSISYYIGGSIASSIYGIARATIDVDIFLDVIGVIKVQGDTLDKNYLRDWSHKLQLFDLMNKAFVESGIKF